MDFGTKKMPYCPETRVDSFSIRPMPEIFCYAHRGAQKPAGGCMERIGEAQDERIAQSAVLNQAPRERRHD